MKLPEDRTERIKVLVLVAIGGVLVVYGLYVGIFKQIQNQMTGASGKITELKERLSQAEIKVKRMDWESRENHQLATQIVAIATVRMEILRSRLGNFLLGATEDVDRAARAVGVETESVRELGITEIPTPKGPKTESKLKAYSARVNMRAGYKEVLDLVRHIEQTNPFLCVSAITITADAATPATHTISLDIQYPIWADEETPVKIEEQLAEYEARQKPTRQTP